MSEEMNQQSAAQFERQDLSAMSVVGFLAALAIVGVASYFVLAGMYGYLDRYDQAHQPPQNPLVKSGEKDTRRARMGDEKKFPQPRLEMNERTELGGFRAREEQLLHSYGWIDEKAGTVRIPIGRAMELTVQRGLPVRPPSDANRTQGVTK